MIAAKEDSPLLTPDEYFTWEKKQVEKHEYINGRVYAMGEGSFNHGRIAIRLTALFDAHLLGSRCITGNSDIKIKLLETNNYTYLDASVTCDDHDQNTPNYFTYPCLIVEVLSKSTEAYDRGSKFRMYRHNPILQDYLLVSSTQIEMNLYHKKETVEWVIINYQAGDMIELKSINLTFPIDQVYHGLTLTPEP
ncbi:Uma2 family endonuclease [Trichothermofontia sp.]